MIGDLLASRMQKIIRRNVSRTRLTPTIINTTLNELKLCLLEADVHHQVVDKMLAMVKDQVQHQLVAAELKPADMVIKLVHQTVLTVLGTNPARLDLATNPAVIMLVGLQGSGKTTTCAKLSHLIAKQNSKNPLLVAADPYRPGAIEQLKTLGAELQLPVFADSQQQDPVQIVEQALQFARKHRHNVLLVDTAGRSQVAADLMAELKMMQQKLSPSEVLLVVDGMVGQDIINQVQAFHALLKLTGVIITKLDGDSRGGAALSVRYLTQVPVKFIGTGEQSKHLQRFYPDRMANRIMGMGDLKTFFETINDQLDHRSLKVTMRRMMRGQFDLQDMLNQMTQIKKMGSLKSIARMLPGARQVSDERLANIEAQLYHTKLMIQSMTNTERREFRLLKHLTRKQRIIRGAGRSEQEYNKMLNHFHQSKKKVDLLAKQIRRGEIPSLAKLRGLHD